MSKPNSYTTLVNSKQVTFTHLGPVQMPPFKDVTSVSVTPFTKDGNIVAVRLRHRGIDIPGGHVEPSETTPEETLRREVMEEAHMTIQKPVLIEAIGSDYFDHPSYMLLYTAFVDKLHEFTLTDEMSYERIILSQEDFISQYRAGDKRLMRLAVKAGWQQLQAGARHQIPVYTVHLPEYQVTAEPDTEAIGQIVDTELRKHFLDKTIVARGIGSSEHPGKTIDELVEIIKQCGTDRYDSSRTGDRYENIQGKHIDLFGFRRKVTPRMQLFKDIVYGFYHSAIGIHGKPTRIDILIIYDVAKLKAVVHQYKGRLDKKRDGFVFREPSQKQDALLGIIRVL